MSDAQALLATIAAACAALAVLAGWRESARKRRHDPDAVGPVDWVTVQVTALVGLGIVALLALKG